MNGKIEEEIINLDIEKIDFDDKELLKRLFLLLLNRIELQAVNAGLKLSNYGGIKLSIYR